MPQFFPIIQTEIFRLEDAVTIFPRTCLRRWLRVQPADR